MNKQSGQVLVISVIFLTVMLVLMSSLLGFVGQNVLATRKAVAKEQALQLADAGIDKAIWRLNETAGSYSGETGTVLGAGTMTIAVANISGSVKEITATAYVPNSISPRATRTVKVQASIDTTVISFAYAVQVGPGGLNMANTSRINGNVFSSGIIDGANSARIAGDAYSSGPAGKIQDIQIDGTAWAHTIKNSGVGGNSKGYDLQTTTVGGSAYHYSISGCTVGGNAFYTTKSSCTIGGTQTTPYAGESDPATPAFPITGQQITDWKTAAAAGETIAGNYTLDGDDTATLGPKKIIGNLELKNQAELTLTGPLWVTGNIKLSNTTKIILDPSYGGNSEVMVADGTFSTANSAIFQGAGTGSYVMMVTTSSSLNAIDIQNSAQSLVAYAPNGTANISNTAKLKELTANKLNMQNSATLDYETGLADMHFISGPGGSWALVRGTWREVK